jgi:serine/threonine protein kinase
MSVSAIRSAPPPPSLGQHEMLAKQFRLVRFLGAGPDGTALLATRRDGGEEVALCFVQEHAQTDALLERWCRYQLVNHPQVISLQQVEYAGGDWCAVLDVSPHGTLDRALSDPWKPDAALQLLDQLAGALAAAHDVGLWHGHLSPAAVLLDPGRGARLEFTGVAVWGDAAFAQSPSATWQERDRYDDVRDLGGIAERLFGGSAAALSRLPWLARLLHDDPILRPSAVEVQGLIHEVVQAARSAARRAFQTIDTERPAPPTDTQTSVAPPKLNLSGPLEGTRIGRFQIEALLGEGGMGSVYRAVDVASGQRVALKLLKPDLLGDEGVRYRFNKEARVLKAVKSPYIANLIEAGLSDTVGYIALEFVDGTDLATAIDSHDGPIPEMLALQIVADMSRALVEPHRRGIVHRDIKPQNVLLVGDLKKPDGIAIKLCDFGIASAKLSAETVGMTQDGRIWGTPQYMAPEQCSSGPVSPATDVYALGLTLYELIAGRPAFEGDELLQLLRQQLSEQPPKLNERASVSDGTVALVERALEKPANRRFADAGELLAAIEQIRNGQVQLASTNPLAAFGKGEHVEFSVELASAPHELWPYVSDTNRLNQAIGLPPVAVEHTRDGDGKKVFLSNQVLGLRLRWQEHPFEWMEGQRWSVLRVFESGAMRWYCMRMELEPLPSGGTRLCYSMDFEPRYWILGFLVRFEVGVKQKNKLLSAFRRIDGLLQSGAILRTPSPHALPAAPSSKLARQLAAKLEPLEKAGVPAPIRAALTEHVLNGSEAEIARLRPLRFARARKLDERAFTEACLLAAHAGVFDLLWDVVCPLCQIPASFAESLARLETHSSCPACELTYPLQFAESVELVFRVPPELRPNELQAYCIGGPAHSPHVSAQVRLAPGEGRVLSLALEDGRHRVRSPELPGVLELDVSSEHPFSRADLALGSRLSSVAPQGNADPRLALSVTESTVQLASGMQTLGLRNELQQELTVRIERTATRDDALTAARAWAMPKFRELFPGETLESGRLVAVGQQSFLVLRVLDHLGLIDQKGDAAALAETVRLFDRLQASAEKHHGRLASTGMDVSIAAFERAEDAIDGCRELLRALEDASLTDCAIALHRGPAVATSIDDRMAYYGLTLARALTLAQELGPRQAVISSAALADDPARLGSSDNRETAVRPAPVLGPAAWCLHLQLASEGGSMLPTERQPQPSAPPPP